MHKLVLISFITVLCSCVSTITHPRPHFFYFDEATNSTTIKGIKELDSLTLLGKWETNENTANYREFYLRNNENLVSLNGIKKSNQAEFKNAPDIELLANQIAHFNYLCNYFHLKSTVLETDDASYHIVNYLHEKTKHEVVHLIGLKNSTVIIIAIINPKKNTTEKIKYCKELFNYIKV